MDLALTHGTWKHIKNTTVTNLTLKMNLQRIFLLHRSAVQINISKDHTRFTYLSWRSSAFQICSASQPLHEVAWRVNLFYLIEKQFRFRLVSFAFCIAHATSASRKLYFIWHVRLDSWHFWLLFVWYDDIHYQNQKEEDIHYVLKLIQEPMLFKYIAFQIKINVEPE